MRTHGFAAGLAPREPQSHDPNRMSRAEKEAIILAMSLAFLSGLVDAMGYMQLGGFFVSFMTGNSTRPGSISRGAGERVALAAVLIVLFVTGVVLAVFRAGAWRRAAAMSRCSCWSPCF